MTNNYIPSDRLIDLIEGNYRLLQVISRFGIPLGFGDKTVDEVCTERGVDATTFLAIINFVHSGYTQLVNEPETLSIPTLIEYLRQSHVYFLDFLFPSIHRQLHSALHDDGKGEISGILHRQFDKYISHASRHMRQEESVLFPYVEKLQQGQSAEGFSISAFSRRHEPLDDSLRELKRILIQYNSKCENVNELNAVLYQIYCCEDELESHCKAEDYIFVPAVFHLEERVRNANG